MLIKHRADSTMAGINSGSTAEQNQTAQATVTDQTNKIVAALNAGKTTAAKIKARGECSCESDEDQQQIVDDSCNLVYELTWTYQGVTDVWGDCMFRSSLRLSLQKCEKFTN